MRSSVVALDRLADRALVKAKRLLVGGHRKSCGHHHTSGTDRVYFLDYPWGCWEPSCRIIYLPLLGFMVGIRWGTDMFVYSFMAQISSDLPRSSSLLHLRPSLESPNRPSVTATLEPFLVTVPRVTIRGRGTFPSWRALKLRS